MADQQTAANNVISAKTHADEPEVAAVVTDVPEVEEKTTPEAVASVEEEDEDSETKGVVEDVTASNVEDEEEEVTSDLKVAVAVKSNATEITTENSDLYPENEMKALVELKKLIQTALNNHEFIASSPAALVQEVRNQGDAEPQKSVVKEEMSKESVKAKVNEDGSKTLEAIEETVVVTSDDQQKTPESSTQESSAEQKEVKIIPEEVSIWGVPLLKDEKTDTILWKFLRARDFKVNEAFTMIKSTIKWRNEFKIDELVEEDLGDELEKMVFMHGFSKEGHPVCYNVYGAFQNKELYQKTFSDEEKRFKFLKWRIQFLEKSIRKMLDFSHGGISSMVQVNDLKNSPGPGKWELRQATKQALQLLQDNYPEFVAKQVFINVPWWYVAVNKMISPFLTQRTKSKFVVAGPSKSAETLFSYIAPEQVPVQYGGFSKEGEFGTKDGVTQIIVKPTCKETVEFAVTEACHLTWEVRVLGWEVSYGAEFVPNAKDNYTVIIQKTKKVGATEGTIISNSFKTSEPGKIVFIIDNSSSKKKRLLYRLKTKPSFE